MSSFLIAIGAFIGYILAYRFYGTFISERIFGIDRSRKTPAHEFEDGVDYVPTKKEVLLGHHFTSIAGAAPIVGPAIAVIWGWVPALLWVVLGSIFMGAVHDLGALIVSARHQGRSISDLTEDLVGPRARTLFLLLTFFAILIVIAVFCLVIAVLFTTYPQSVFPIWMEIPTALLIGYWIYRKSGNPTLAGLLALAALYVFVYIGVYLPIEIPAFIGGNIILTWVIILLVYAYIASTLPVWVLLQPRDYINSHQLYLALLLIYAGLFVARPEIVAPAVNLNVEGAPAFIPFLFITIACGAISGFHSMVSSGTTVKQLDNEGDAKAIGYGGMILEGILATVAVLACTAGFASRGAWEAHYASWGAASGLGAKVGAFVAGAASFVDSLGINPDFALGVVAVLVVSFAATTLDSATRIQRYIITELANDYNIKPLATRHGATIVAVGTAFLLALINGGKGGLILWPIFGATNQLMAALALLMVTVWLVKIRKPTIYTTIPMLFVLVMTSWAMIINVKNFIAANNTTLTILGIAIILLEIWLLVEAFVTFGRIRREPAAPAAD